MKRAILLSSLLWSVAGALFAPPAADAGNWSSQTLGDTPPLWMDYRASVNDAGVIAGARMVGTTATEPIVSESGTSVTVLPTPVLQTPAHLTSTPLAAVVQGAAMELTQDGRVVGFRAGANPAQRQASFWAKSGANWVHRDLHGAVLAAHPTYAYSAAYGVIEGATNQFLVAGYLREWISPLSLSKPALWSVSEVANSGTVTLLPLPATLTPAAQAYGIAYSVSGLDRASKRYACGGVGVSSSFMHAQCWDVSNPAAPLFVTTPAGLSSSSDAATSVVQRVRTIDFGAGGNGAWQGLQNIAVGYVTYKNGATEGFVWNLTTGVVDNETALGAFYDALLSDVTKQSFAHGSARQNGTSGAVYHGPLVVGAGATDDDDISAGASLPTHKPSAVRAIYQARLGSVMQDASAAKTCDMDAEASGLTQTLSMISGVSRDGRRMVGDAGGKLTRLTNTLLDKPIAIFARNAVVYSTLSASTPVTYHWAEVPDVPTARVIWSNSAGCEELDTGLSCRSSLSGSAEAPSTRRSGASPTPTATYIQFVKTSGGCEVSPVFALADLTATINPATNSALPSGAPAEDWRACGATPAPATRGGVLSGSSVNVRQDFYHCGGCNQSSDDGLSCTNDSCVNGVRTNTRQSNTCLIGGNCYASGAANPANQCTRCLPSANTFGTNTPPGTAVSTCTDTDGLACTLPRCNGTGSCQQDQAIAANTCLIGGVCRANDFTNPANQCQACRSATNARAWSSKDNGTSCNTDSCKQNMTCTSGSCSGGTWIRDAWEGANGNDTTSNALQLSGPDGDSGRSFHEDDYWDNHRTQSGLTSFPEDDVDWYWFWSDDWYRDWFWTGYGGTANGTSDDSGANDQPQPRVRLIPPAGVDLELCMYIQCANSSGATINGRYRGTSMLDTSSSHQPHPNGYPGVCSRAGSGATEDLELHWNCSGTNETARVWVKVYKYSGTTTCHMPYTLEWGNDKDR